MSLTRILRTSPEGIVALSWNAKVNGGRFGASEVEGNEKPCFVGDSVTRLMAPAE